MVMVTPSLQFFLSMSKFLFWFPSLAHAAFNTLFRNYEHLTNDQAYDNQYLRKPYILLRLRKRYNKALKYVLKLGFAEECVEVYKNCSDHWSSNLRLNEISLLIILLQINRNQLGTVVKATWDLIDASEYWI